MFFSSKTYKYLLQFFIQLFALLENNFFSRLDGLDQIIDKI